METKRDYLINHLRKCERESISLASHCSLVWQYWRGLVRTTLSNLAEAARQKVQITRPVKGLLSQLQVLSLNKRHAVGIVLWMVGIASLFAHLFFDPYSVDHQVCRVLGFDLSHCWNGKGGNESTGWCYTSWFDYLTQIRFFLALLFWSVALPLLVPPKFSISIIPASLLHAVAWCWILHYSFFSHSYETITAFPHWQIVVIALVLGFSIVLSSNYLIHTYNHRTLAFEKRLGTLYNGLDLLDGDTFKEQYRKFYEEKKAFQKQY